MCTLTDRDLIARALEFRAVFAHLLETQPFDRGFRWRFKAELDLEPVLADLARREHECCRFFEFIITRNGDCIAWETRASRAATTMLDAFMRLPETLERDSDLGAIKRAVELRGSSR